MQIILPKDVEIIEFLPLDGENLPVFRSKSHQFTGTARDFVAMGIAVAYAQSGRILAGNIQI